MKTQFSEFLNEVHHYDYYSSTFIEFKDRYNKLKRKGEIDYDNIYVQFTNYNADSLERNPFLGNEDTYIGHYDPAAVYAYPLKYVLNYPSDIWYASNSKYLRVLLDKSKNKLVLSDISEQYFYRLFADFYKIYVSPTTALKNALSKNNANVNKISGKNKWGKLFFELIQVNYEAVPVDESGVPYYKKLKYPYRTNIEQTEIFKKLGYDAIQDKSNSNNSAVINEREPEQIAFLNRYAFEVLEICTINSKSRTTNTTRDFKLLCRKMASRLAEIMGGDKLVSGPMTDGLNGWSYFWTAKGRRIGVLFSRDESYYVNRKLGEKRHKEFKDNDEFNVFVELETERGFFEYTLNRGSQIDNIYIKLKNDWDSSAGISVDEWEPLSNEQFINNLRKKRDKDVRDSIIKEYLKDKDYAIEKVSHILTEMSRYVDKPTINIDVVDPKDYYFVLNGDKVQVNSAEYSKYMLYEDLDTVLRTVYSYDKKLHSNTYTPEIKKSILHDATGYIKAKFELRMLGQYSNAKKDTDSLSIMSQEYTKLLSIIKDPLIELIKEFCDKVIDDYLENGDDLFVKFFIEKKLGI